MFCRRLTFALILVAIAGYSTAAVIHVPADQASIQDAVSAASALDTVLIAPGSYAESVDFLGKSVKVLGAGATPGEVLLTGPNDGGDSPIAFRNGEGQDALLSNITITGWSGQVPPALLCSDASPRIQGVVFLDNGLFGFGKVVQITGGVDCAPSFIDCLFLDSKAANGGGASVEEATRPSFENCTFDGGRARRGGAISCIQSAVVSIDGCVFRDCRADSLYPTGAHGGALRVEGDASVTIRDSEFVDCVAMDEGGAIFLAGSNVGVEFEACRFVRCKADVGAAIRSDTFAALSLVDCEFEYCVANLRGGAVALNFGGTSATVLACRFLSCQASGDGGAIHLTAGASLLAQDSGFESCVSGSSGGAVLVSNDCAADFTDCWFDRCRAELSGGAIEFMLLEPSVVAGCTFVGNAAPFGSALSSTIAQNLALERSIIALGEGQVALMLFGSPDWSPICCDFYGNEGLNMSGGVGDPIGLNGNIDLDPMFCDSGNGDFRVNTDSPCLPDNNDCGVLMGAFGAGCGSTSAEETPQPGEIDLHQNSPNPFNPSTSIVFDLSAAARVSLNLFDIRGRPVKTLLSGRPLSAGRHELSWKGRDDEGNALPSGVYFYRLDAGDEFASRKMLLLK